MKRIIAIVLFFFVIALHSAAQESSFEELEEGLFSRGYVSGENAYLYRISEVLIYLEQRERKKFEIHVPARKYEGKIEFYFLFLSKEKANLVVLASIYDEEGNEREYYKINTNNEPANTWVAADMNMDGVIEEGEGHIAWW